jgi:FdhD protein
MLEAAPLRRTAATARIVSVRDGVVADRTDRLATEEPMEIRVGGPGQEPVALAVTMRTPGHDFELAGGFLLTEGIIAAGEDVASLAYCELPEEEQQYNVVTVRLSRPFEPEGLRRSFFTTSSCGVCGKASLEQVRVVCSPIGDGPVVPGAVVASLPEALRRGQRVFEETGGLHAAGLFTAEGEALAVMEDVGRHNAVDKVVGRSLLDGRLPLSDRILAVSGRVSFEIVQKAAVAGIPIVCAVSAPSSLAVEAGEELGVTVVGFVRGSGFNVYSRPERVRMA